MTPAARIGLFMLIGLIILGVFIIKIEDIPVGERGDRLVRLGQGGQEAPGLATEGHDEVERVAEQAEPLAACIPSMSSESIRLSPSMCSMTR